MEDAKKFQRRYSCPLSQASIKLWWTSFINRCAGLASEDRSRSFVPLELKDSRVKDLNPFGFRLSRPYVLRRTAKACPSALLQ